MPFTDPSLPTSALPGSPEKIAVLALRAELRLPLFVAGDAGFESASSPPAPCLYRPQPAPPLEDASVQRIGRRDKHNVRYRARLWIGERWVRLGDYPTRAEARAAVRAAA